MHQRNLIILKGTSGTGKTSFCNLIADKKAICCADDFFYDDKGVYNWNAELLGRAHANCKHQFDWALKDESIDNIIIANVNSKVSDYKYYVDQAENAGLRVTYIVLEKRHDNENLHNVPLFVLERQANAIKENLKLL